MDRRKNMPKSIFSYGHYQLNLAIQAVFPEARIQTCIAYLIRYSLDYASWKERKAVTSNARDGAPRLTPLTG